VCVCACVCVCVCVRVRVCVRVCVQVREFASVLLLPLSGPDTNKASSQFASGMPKEPCITLKEPYTCTHTPEGDLRTPLHVSAQQVADQSVQQRDMSFAKEHTYSSNCNY